MTIILYDIPSEIGVWAPNPWKTRMALNYKGLEYKTEWVDFPDIEPSLKKLGVPPSSKKADGSDYYSVPVIYDQKTEKYVVDAFVIAQYLDETYPDTPRLFPPGSYAAVALFENQFSKSYLSPVLPLTLIPTYKYLTPRGQEYFRRTREKAFQKKIEDVAPPGPVREEMLTKVKEGLSELAAFYEKNGKDKLFFFGDTFSYADVIMASFLIWPKLMMDAKEWELIAGFDGGRWGKLAEATKDYQRSDL